MSQHTNPVPFVMLGTPALDTRFWGARGWPSAYDMLPPGPIDLDEFGTLRRVDGVMYLGNTPLGTASDQTGPASGQDLIGQTQGMSNIKDLTKYGDAQIANITFTAGGFSTLLTFSANGSIVLPRPQGYRAALLIQNVSVGGLIFYNYDQDADANSMPIGLGGSRNYAGEAVPQGNLSLFSTGAGTVVIEYMNISIPG